MKIDNLTAAEILISGHIPGGWPDNLAGYPVHRYQKVKMKEKWKVREIPCLKLSER